MDYKAKFVILEDLISELIGKDTNIEDIFEGTGAVLVAGRVANF